eukprot:1342493-Rhodomonas_salina.2
MSKCETRCNLADPFSSPDHTLCHPLRSAAAPYTTPHTMLHTTRCLAQAVTQCTFILKPVNTGDPASTAAQQSLPPPWQPTFSRRRRRTGRQDTGIGRHAPVCKVPHLHISVGVDQHHGRLRVLRRRHCLRSPGVGTPRQNPPSQVPPSRTLALEVVFDLVLDRARQKALVRGISEPCKQLSASTTMPLLLHRNHGKRFTNRDGCRLVDLWYTEPSSESANLHLNTPAAEPLVSTSCQTNSSLRIPNTSFALIASYSPSDACCGTLCLSPPAQITIVLPLFLSPFAARPSVVMCQYLRALSGAVGRVERGASCSCSCTAATRLRCSELVTRAPSS